MKTPEERRDNLEKLIRRLEKGKAERRRHVTVAELAALFGTPVKFGQNDFRLTFNGVEYRNVGANKLLRDVAVCNNYEVD